MDNLFWVRGNDHAATIICDHLDKVSAGISPHSEMIWVEKQLGRTWNIAWYVLIEAAMEVEKWLR